MKRYSVVLLGLLAGCSESVESNDVRTSGIYPEFEVVADGGGDSEATARLKVGGNNSNTYLDLTGDDELTVTANSTERTMDEASGQRYRVAFEGDDGGTEFVFAFLRGDEDDDAPMSKVELPEPFTMMVETANAVRGTDDVDLTWTEGGSGDIDLTIRGDCIFDDFNERTPDDGAHTISAADIHERGTKSDEECTVTVSLSRINSGDLDRAFTEGGEVTARQTRSGTFRSLPAE